MMPAAFVVLDSLPLLPNGKVNRAALPAPETPDSTSATIAPRSGLERTIAAVWKEVLSRQRVGLHDSFFDLGGHSLLLVRVQDQLRQRLSVELGLTELFQYPTIASLAAHLGARGGPRSDNGGQPLVSPPSGEPLVDPPPGEHLVRPPLGERSERRRRRHEARDVAILAMAGRFPGAADLDRLWENLRAGEELISFFSDRKLAEAGVDPAHLEHPDYVRAAGALAGADLFDAPFFDLAPREAAALDPQHRLFLECAWESLERAGYGAADRRGAVGVFAGASFSTYLDRTQRQPSSPTADLQTLISNDKDFLATRVSYKLDLKGPGVTVQTACSTSLVAVHLACQSLLAGECDLALAGAASVRVPLEAGYLYEQGGILSPDGHCRAFAADAGGTVPGSGVGVVVLKPLAAALADGDPILAVIRGTAVNNDGAVKVGYTAPSVEGQAAVLSEACGVAGVDPETLSYVEAHGTGTPLGDPIEVAALNRALGGTAPCALGSVKTNVGHLDAAAGIAGLIKTVLALRHRQIPPSLHCRQTHPEIDFAASRFYVNTVLRDWPRSGSHRRRAGVSSFGVGGTNVHAVLEEAPAVTASDAPGRGHLLVLSARTGPALQRASAALAEHLRRRRDVNLADVAYTLQVGRQAFEHRRFLTCRDLAGAIAELEQPMTKRFSHFAGEGSPSLVFLFPGQGAQTVDPGAELYRREPVFRRHLDRCAELFEPHLDCDVRRLLYPPDGERQSAQRRLRETVWTQPALFVVEYALGRLWMERVGRPAAMIGHSLGEYVAACLAGVFSLADAVALVAQRGRLMAELPAGAMLSVPLAEAELLPLLGPDLALAAVNGPDRVVVSGPAAAVDELADRLASEGVTVRRLATSHAFHSPMMEPILAPFARVLRGIELRPPQIPYVSNLTGTWIGPTQATSIDHWVRHLRHTVRFGDGLARLLEDPDALFVEVGPGRTLSSLIRRQGKEAAQRLVVASLPDPRRGGCEVEHWLSAVGRLWLAGYPVDWRGFSAGQRRCRLELPTYPFERRRYWLDPGPRARPAAGRRQLADWFYLPLWKPRPLPHPPPGRPAAGTTSPQLLFVDAWGLGDELARRLAGAGHEPILVRCGEGFARLGEHEYALDPGRRQDYVRLLAELAAAGRAPAAIVHLWSVTSDGEDDPGGERFQRLQELGLYSLLFLIQALADEAAGQQRRLTVVSSSLHSVHGEASQPEKATLLALCRIVPQEVPNLGCRSVDVDLPAAGNRQVEEPVAALLAELAGSGLPGSDLPGSDLPGSGLPAPVGREPVVAWRQGRRWVEGFEAVRLEGAAPPLRRRGVYLISGGLGRLGLQLAEYLARSVQARLVLVGRTPFPVRNEWPEWLGVHGSEDAVSRKILRLQACEAMGAEVLVGCADVADEGQMQTLLARARQSFGPVHGVVHAAGLVGGNAFHSVVDTGPAECEAHFRAKVYGLLTLEKVLAPHAGELDFCLLFSSLSSALGGPGLCAYTAANLFLEAFAGERRRQGGMPWKSVCWDVWQRPETETQDPAAISAQQGEEAFGRLLQWTAEPRVLVSTEDLESRIVRWRAAAASGPAAKEASELHPRPEIASSYVAPRNDVERSVAQCWQEVLGIERVGIHDDFFELGGDSLLATELGLRVQSTLRVDLSLRRFFASPTVAGIAAALSCAQAPSETLAQQGEDEAEIEQLLQEVERLSSGEVSAELMQRDTGRTPSKEAL
ncbi:MAG: SDR family oxidoreductase [Acidobacteriota bacterium]